MAKKETRQYQELHNNIISIPALRNPNIDSFHGYVEDKNGIGKTSPDLEISPLDLMPIECGLGSSVTGAPEGVPNAGIDYPHPFHIESSKQLLNIMDLNNVDPDLVIWRTSREKLLDEITRTLPAIDTQIIIHQSDYTQEIYNLEMRNHKSWKIIKDNQLNKSDSLFETMSESLPSVILVNTNDLEHEEIQNLVNVAETNGHFLIVEDEQQSHTETLSNSQHTCTIGSENGNSYAILSESAFITYKPHRMVFMLPNHAFEPGDKNTSNSYELQLNKIILSRYNIEHLPANNIIWGDGSYDLIDQLVALLPQKQIIGIGPHFPYLIQHVDRNHKSYLAYEANNPHDHTQTIKNLSSIIEDQNTDPSIIYLDSPSNPSGHVHDIDDIRNLAKISQQKGHTLIVDCAYGDLVENIKDYFQLASEYPNVCVLGSLSKNLGLAADRLGYAVLGDSIIDHINTKLLPSPITKRAFQKASAAFNEKSLSKHIEISKVRIRNGKQKLIEHLTIVNENLESSNPKIQLQISSTHDAVSILYVSIYGLEEKISILLEKNPHISLGRILQERWQISCEPGEEFTQTHTRLGINGFRLRIPSNIQDSEEIANRIQSMILEVKNNPLSILENCN